MGLRKVRGADGAAVQITIEDLSPVKKKIGVALPAEEVRAEIDQAYRGLQQRARIKGFRPGRVPRWCDSVIVA